MGGLNGNGNGRADAIAFTDGTNSLELQKGWPFIGNVVGEGGSINTLKLGGNATDLSGTGNGILTVFNLDQIGAEFQGFSAFDKTGTSTWELTGTTTSTTPWTIIQGALILNGSLPAPVNVEPAGVLGGTGMVLNTVTNVGTVEPGFALSVGTFGRSPLTTT